ncbi:MAG: signal peptidase II [Pseudomonadales bacterium]
MWFYAVSLLIIIADQVLKKYMSGLLPLCEPGYCKSIEILPVFRLTLLHNEGAAFSFLSDAGGWQRWLLIAISTGVSSFIAVWLYRVRHTEKLLAVALALILGGAIGNLVDRVLNGYVIDFILLHYGDWYFPAFNLADSAISVGAAVLILDMIVRPKEVEQASD